MNLLIEVLSLYWADRRDYFVGGNMFFYFSALQAKKNDFRGPDFFVVLDVEHRQRDSWVAWEEGGRYPNVIIELTSPSTAAVDRGEKKRIYEQVLRIPEYFIFDPWTGVLEGYRLSKGKYEPILPGPEGLMESEQLDLKLGTWLGAHQGYEQVWLRFFDRQGRLLPTEHEGRQKAEQERQKAEQERQKAEQERQKAEQERQKAEQERQKAEQERQLAEAKARQLEERLLAYERQFGPMSTTPTGS
jgi:Uma2 family endonuclease